jgi:hypothetical protein
VRARPRSRPKHAAVAECVLPASLPNRPVWSLRGDKAEYHKGRALPALRGQRMRASLSRAPPRRHLVAFNAQARPGTPAKACPRLILLARLSQFLSLSQCSLASARAHHYTTQREGAVQTPFPCFVASPGMPRPQPHGAAGGRRPAWYVVYTFRPPLKRRVTQRTSWCAGGTRSVQRSKSGQSGGAPPRQRASPSQTAKPRAQPPIFHSRYRAPPAALIAPACAGGAAWRRPARMGLQYQCPTWPLYDLQSVQLGHQHLPDGMSLFASDRRASGMRFPQGLML